MYDVAIVGAGVIGASVARELMKYQLKVVVLEKGNDVAIGTTKANSAIVHAGYDAPFGSNKGRFNALGNRIFGEICDELNVPFNRIGSLVCAFDEEDMTTLKALKENGESLGIPGLRIIDQAMLRAFEPNISDLAIGALYAPSAGITEPWELTVAYMENAMDNGANLMLNFEVIKIDVESDGFLIHSSNQTVRAKRIVNAAGVYTDTLYKMVCDSPEFTIHPRRGQYFLLDKNVNGLVNHVIFPCPSKLGKGILVLPTTEGNLLVGPDSEDLESTEREAIETTGNRLDYIKESAAKLVNNIPYRENITTFAGLRAEPSTGDFIIGEGKISGFYNLAGMKSPGLSSAPAIGKHVATELSKSLKAPLNPHFNPIRQKRIRFEKLSDAEKAVLIKEKPAYGRIICRCESITEGEILDAIHRNCGGRTLNGIKRRARPGAGRCQGGFCGPRVMEILSRELAVPVESICQESSESFILIGKTKSEVTDNEV